MNAQPSIGPAGTAIPGMSLERHIQERQRSVPGATGDFTGLFTQISLAAKIIHSRVHRAGLAGILGLTGKTNVQGEEVAKLDIFANQVLISAVEAGGHVCIMASEENEEAIQIPPEYPAGKYVLMFDPLDGSGNIDINASIGTIFSIHRRRSKEGRGQVSDCLRFGYEQVAAGYIIYGSSTMLVYSDGDEVFGFTMDPSIGEFLLSHDRMKIPKRGNRYSINEGNRTYWDPSVREWVDWLKEPDSATGRPYGIRYIGAMVADFHRTLLEGGIFAYPGDSRKPKGKLRLLYECAPLAFICEAAGGAASDGKGRILDIEATSLHQRTPMFVGSVEDVEDCLRFIGRK